MIQHAEIVIGECKTALWNTRLQILKYVLWENENVKSKEGFLESSGPCLSFDDLVLEISKDFHCGFASVRNACDEPKLGLDFKKISCYFFGNLR